jgi:anti-sigma factor RsiW
MTITKSVIQDLLPAYLAGEASADTRTLVEQYLKHDPDLARQVEQQRAGPVFAARLDPATATEKEALVRARKLIRVRQWLLAGIIFFALSPFLTVIGSNGVEWMLWRDAPAAVAPLLVLAAACFVLRLRKPGL